jgi:hypothetical protein
MLWKQLNLLNSKLMREEKKVQNLFNRLSRGENSMDY